MVGHGPLEIRPRPPRSLSRGPVGPLYGGAPPTKPLPDRGGGREYVPPALGSVGGSSKPKTNPRARQARPVFSTKRLDRSCCPVPASRAPGPCRPRSRWEELVGAGTRGGTCPPPSLPPPSGPGGLAEHEVAPGLGPGSSPGRTAGQDVLLRCQDDTELKRARARSAATGRRRKTARWSCRSWCKGWSDEVPLFVRFRRRPRRRFSR